MVYWKNRWIMIFCFLLSFSAWGRPLAEHVIVISMDGASPAVIKKTRMPVFKEMAEQGAHSFTAQTIVPSITLPSHTSMLSGVGPEIHKILWNDWSPEKGIVKVPLIFDLAKNAGFKTAFFAAKEKFKHLNIPGAFDEFSIISENAPKVATAAGRYFEAELPNLLFFHFKDADEAGHRYTWGSKKQKAALEKIDTALDTLKKAVENAGVSQQTVFIITADHGGTWFGHDKNIPENRTIPWVAWGAGVKSHFTINSRIQTMDTAATALFVLDVPAPKSWTSVPVAEAFLTDPQ
jgi:predicted AlkP superfamily pyrophosphatase or phosphodiesterase